MATSGTRTKTPTPTRLCCRSAVKVILAVAVTAIAGLFDAGWAQMGGATEGYVAKAGDVFISEREFVQRFEMLPGLYRHRIPQLETAKLELLYSMIAEKLLAQEAIARKFDEDSTVRSAFAEVRRLLARDELYREEVSNKVSITDDEIKKGIAQARMQLLLEFACFEQEDDARFVRAQIRNGGDFDRLQIDSSLSGVKDTATVVWGNANADIEAAAYRLRQGEVSPVVRADGRFYILKRSKTFSNAFYSSMQPEVLRERVVTKIRQRKEGILAADFVHKILLDKVGRSLPTPFTLLAKSMIEVFKHHSRDSLVSLTPDMVLSLRARIRGALSDTLVEVGDAGWTIDNVIARLLNRRFSVPAEDLRSTPSRLNAEIRVMVQQELLGQEAVNRGLDNVPSVRQQLEMWQDAYLAEMMRDYISQRVTVSDAEVYSYLRSKDTSTAVPRVQIRELRTGSISEMSEALSDIEEGMAFGDAIEKWSDDPVGKGKKGVSDFFPITARPPIGEIASHMEIGQRYGPVKIPDGFLYFELLGRDPSVGQGSDTTFGTKMQSAREELLRSKQKRMLDLFLAQVGQERGFMVYEDRLSKIEVSPIPMMTFRMLGFGGRMIAVPFVPKALDWLDVVPPKDNVLP